ncbi:lytic transglycosylase domain-containing protein, partial [Pedococcus sp.]|uniref:lytic transglycosylase domain-containing protein n=1 Tax=Pedococcus sp. TaxID=2860345 RepID=UPI002E139023|nr:lytic transglycosylase domain-containing protein [Pedococcus sp.]
MTRVTRLPWRTIAAGLPAVALIGTGVALATTGAGTAATHRVADSRPVVTVPSTPISQPAEPSLPPLPDLPAPAEQSATPLGQSAASLPTALTANGIPALALAAYQRAASLVDAADAGCHIDWALIAAIGKVESDHGRYAGNGIDRDGSVRPGIYGIPLNGANNTTVIHDTDAGVLDHDTVWDRAVGPMQFIPSTWRVVGVDANGDGKKDPQNIDDAAAATAVYLCSGPGDLSTDSGARNAVMRYNQSQAYVDEVMAIAAGYRGGYTVVPDSGLNAAQRNGTPYLPSGDPQVMAHYNPVLAAQPAPAKRPSGGTKPSSGGSPVVAAGSGSSGGAGALTGGGTTGGTTSGSGGGSSSGTVAGVPVPQPVATVGGVVGGVVGGLTGHTPTPTTS